MDYDRSNAVVTTELVDAFAYMAVWYRRLGRKVLAGEVRALALQTYTILNGDGAGFEELYGGV